MHNEVDIKNIFKGKCVSEIYSIKSKLIEEISRLI